VISRLTGEKSAMKLEFATLMQLAKRMSRVSFSESKRQRLKLLKRELERDPPTLEEKSEGREEGSEVAWLGPLLLQKH